jgi:predicted O-methyltransferase YrrM
MKVVELGTDIGRSALFMMTQLPSDSELWTVEIGTHERVDLEPFKGDKRLHVIQGNDLDSRVIQELGDGIDFLFVDTNHEFAQVSAEWLIYRSRLSVGALAAFDDIDLNPGMRQFWAGLLDRKHDCGRDLHVSGFGLAAVDPTV